MAGYSTNQLRSLRPRGPTQMYHHARFPSVRPSLMRS